MFFSHVCPGYNFEPLHIETSFLVSRYIFTISRSSLSIKVIGSRSYENNYNFTSFNMLIHCLWLEVINKVKVTHQGEITSRSNKNMYLPSNFMSSILSMY